MAIPNSVLAGGLNPWFPLFGQVVQAGLRDHLSAVPILGLPRKTERANDLHRAIRENFRRLCDLAGTNLLELREEPDGQGLDYLVSRLADPVAIRWGLYKGGTIKRNNTQRTRSCQEQGLLELPGVDLDVCEADMPLVSLAYPLADDYTEVGVPCWWINRLLLIREREGESEVITTIADFQQPQVGLNTYTTPTAIVQVRAAEIEQWETTVEAIRNAA